MTTTQTATFNGACKACGYKLHIHTTDYRHGYEGTITAESGAQFAVGSWDGFGILGNFGPISIHFCKPRGRMARIRLIEVQGKISKRHECNAKCMASIGPSCECSCGGKNHGASFSA